METKQTAVQWFNQQLINRQNGSGDSRSWDEILQQALQMEREQIIDAYYYDPNCDEIKDDGELYYNEIYGGQDE
jgi:hypothetical protein